MASLATSWAGGAGRQSGSGRPSAGRPEPANNKALVKSTRQGTYALRALPNEDIALWVKSIDNSRVPQQRNPQVSGALWRYIGGAVAAVVLVVGLLLPGAYGWLAGYQLNKLEKDHQALLEQRELLKLEQAKAESPKQLELWAAEHGMKAPDSKRQVYLRPTNEHAVAMKTAAPEPVR
jgi:hypothetical protein